MKILAIFVAVLGFGLAANGSAYAADLVDLKVLYVGSERAKDYVDFLKPKVALIEAKSRAEFQPKDADRFDVVLLDWPQGEEAREMRKLKSPLGTRGEWKTPTVLLGSAGLNLAVCWQLKGGSGCTCLDPLAYDLRDHEIFDRPFKIDRSQMISIPTPQYFRDEIKEKEIKVLPIVTDRNRNWHPGWCTHALNFWQHPDVEFFCGGVNHQTPTSAALWRQGNLLHFGFEQSPAEMNELGGRLLLNSIAYISRFSEDRPIAITPSPFAGPIARPRETMGRWVGNGAMTVDSLKLVLADSVRAELSKQPDRNGMVKWVQAHGPFFHPNQAQQLEIDQDLVALGVPFDHPKFFDKALADLRSPEKTVATRAQRLLERYAPTGPKSATANAWDKWWKENQSFLFMSDDGNYCWYVDPLAKKRGIPVSDLRGPRRADQR